MPHKRMKLLPVKADEETIRRAKAQARKKRLSVSAYVRGLVIADLSKRRRSGLKSENRGQREKVA